MACSSSYQNGSARIHSTTSSGKNEPVSSTPRSSALGGASLLGGGAPVNERIAARQPLPGGETNSGQPTSTTRSHASSWLPRKATILAALSFWSLRTKSITWADL